MDEFYNFKRRALIHEFRSREKELRGEYTMRRLLKRSLNTGASILINTMLFEALIFAFHDQAGDKDSKAVSFRAMIGLSAVSIWVALTAFWPTFSAETSYLVSDCWNLLLGSLEQMCQWGIRDTMIALLALLKNRQQEPHPMKNEILLTIVLLIVIFVMQLAAESTKSHLSSGYLPLGSTRTIKLMLALCRIPIFATLALGWSCNNIMDMMVDKFQERNYFGPFVAFFIQAGYMLVVVSIIAQVLGYVYRNRHGVKGICMKAITALGTQTCVYIFAWAIAGVVEKFYYEILFECASAKVCTYQSKFLFAFVISAGAGQLNITIKELLEDLEQDEAVSSFVPKCEIKHIDGDRVEWAAYDREKTGFAHSLLELLSKSMSLMIGWVWSSAFKGIIQPIVDNNEDNDMFNHSHEFGRFVVSLVVCLAYLCLCIPAFHFSRSAVRSMQMNQIERLVDILHNAQEVDKNAKREEDKCAHSLLDSLEKLVEGSKPVIAPEFVNTIKDVVLPHFRKST